MRDHDECAVLAELGQRLIDQLLAFDVDLARGFVQNQDFRIAEKRPGQRNALALAAAQPLTRLADTRRILFREAS